MTERERHMLHVCAAICLLVGDEARKRAQWSIEHGEDQSPAWMKYLGQSKSRLDDLLASLAWLVSPLGEP